MHVDGVPGRVEDEMGAVGANAGPVEQVVPGAFGNVSFHGGLAAAENRGNEDGVPEQELVADVESSGILREDEEEGAGHGRARHVGFVQKRVHEREELVTEG